jgi:zinc transport system ATP-binding protein
MSLDVLTMAGVSYRYGTSEVLQDISLHIRRGDYIGLVGPNGSGKTTLVKIVLGLLKPQEGRVTLFGEDCCAFTQWHRIGYLPQKISTMNPRFPATVREVVAMGLLARKRFPKYLMRVDEQAIDGALELLDIADLKRRPIGELSGGQQQRVLVARALVNEPELLILDEPTTALDAETRERFFALLHHLNHVKDVTTVIVTHDVANIGRYSTKLLYVDKKLLFFGGFDDFCASSEVTALFGAFAQHIICHRHDESYHA